MKKILVIGLLSLLIIVCLGVVIAQNNFSNVNNKDKTPIIKANHTFSGGGIHVFSALIGNITIDTALPASPTSIRIYLGYFQEGGLIENFPGVWREIQNPVPKDQAPAVAEQILSQYGGLPTDAILQDSFVMYRERLNRTTHEVINRTPTGTFVSWYRTLDGMEVEGDSDIIQVDMGENGTLIRVYKSWRTYESLGNVSIIPVEAAIDKLESGEVLNPLSAATSDVSIYNIHLSYYIKGLEEPNVTTEPIWVFYGNASGNYIPFFVYARKFANFTATPTSGTAPLTVTFNDTSDASPTTWLWDFGDGTNSTVQNATHVYNASGSYNVTLKVWNDLGSDTITKPDYVTVAPENPVPVAPVNDTDWPQFHYNAAHTGLAGTNVSSTPATVRNRTGLKVIGAINPIIANGTIFVLTGYNGLEEPSSLTTISLTALTESSAPRVKWNFTLPRYVHYGSWSSPATDGEYVFVSSDYQHFAVNALTGTEVWNYTGFSVNVNGGPSMAGAYVYFSDWKGNYYNLTKADGHLNWVFNNSKTATHDMQYAQASPAWDSTDGAIYVNGYIFSGGANGTGSRGYIYKVGPDGTEVWSNQSDEGEIFGGSASFDSDNVYVASYNPNGNGTLYAFNKMTGVRVWANETERTYATPAIYEGTVYISGGRNGSAQPGVRAFDTATGILKWSRINENMGGWTDSVSISANGILIVGKESGNTNTFCYNTTYFLNATTGNTTWIWPQGGATAAIANGKVYTVGNEGSLHVFS